MKFEFKERESREFYDEILFVAAHYRKIIINKNKKVTKLSTYMIKNLIISLIFTIILTLYYLKTKSKFEFFMIGVLIALIAFRKLPFPRCISLTFSSIESKLIFTLNLS